MKATFLLPLFLLFFASCTSDDTPAPNSPSSGEPANPANPDNPVNPDNQGSNAGNSMKGSLSFPSTINAAAVDQMYANWIGRYYVTFSEEVSPADYDYLNEYKLPLLKISGRIKYDTPEQTVSEGVGYGMLLTAFQGDKERFDAIMNYYLAWRVSPESGSYFMNWKINGFRGVKGSGSATDADIDIVAALLIAYEKWGDEQYKQYALENASSIYRDEVYSGTHLLMPANAGDFTSGNIYNISYFSLAALHLLVEYDVERDWKSVLEASIEYMKKVQDNGNGLWPDWSDASGVPADAGNGASTTRNGAYKYFGLEGVRIPFRLVWDYLWFGDERVKTMVEKAAQYTYEQVAGGASKAKSSYIYQGEDSAQHGVGGVAFDAAFCSLAMIDSKYADYVSNCNNLVINEPLPSSGTDYFEPSLQMLYAMLLNGKVSR